MGDLSLLNRTALLVLAVLAVAIGYRSLQPHSAFDVVENDADWNAAVHQSREQNRPAVVLYTAGWCGACQALHRGALADSGVWRELANHHTFVTVDLTNPTDAARAHQAAAGVRGIPTLIRYDADGHETGRTHGLSAPDLVGWLQR